MYITQAELKGNYDNYKHRNKFTKNKQNLKIANPVEEKECKTCEQIKLIDEFHYHSDKRKDGTLCGDGHMSECKVCHGERTSDNKRLAAFNMSREEYETLVIKQNNLCAICGCKNLDGELYVDHCHATAKIRGLLCNSCNLGLGNFRDNVDMLKSAILYLQTNL